MRTRWHKTTEMLEQKKTNWWVRPKIEHQVPTNITQKYIVSKPLRWTIIKSVNDAYLHFRSLIELGSCPNITAPFRTDMPAPSGTITLLLENLEKKKQQKNSNNKQCITQTCCFVVYSTRRFVVCFSVCRFVLVFFGPFGIAVASLGEERANLSAFRTFVRFVLV